MSLKTPDSIRTSQRKLHEKAKTAPGFRFYLLHDRVRNFLVRPREMPSRSIGPFTMEAVFGELGMPGLRHLRRKGAMP